MSELDASIRELEDRIDRLVRTQIDFQKEITAIRGELARLRSARQSTSTPSEPPPRDFSNRPPIREQPKPAYEPPPSPRHETEPILSESSIASSAFSRFASQYIENARGDLEKFIGENLISKIGI